MKPTVDLCYGLAVRRRHAITGAIAAYFAASPLFALAAEKPKAAVVVAGRLSQKDADSVLGDVTRAIAARPELAMIPEDRAAFIFRSTKPAGPKRSKKNLEAAKKALAEASEQLNAFDLPSAVKSVNKAKTSLAGYIGTRAAYEVDRDRLQLAVTIAHTQRDQSKLLAALNEYAIRYPNEPPPQGSWPPDVVNLLKSMNISSSVLNVKSEPSALVHVDGREVGTSPIRLGALPAGEHRVEISRPGYWPIDQLLETTGSREAMIEAKLAPNLSSSFRKTSATRGLDAELEKRVRELAPELAVLILASVEEGKLVLRRIDLQPSPALTRGAAETVRGELGANGARLSVTQLFEVPIVAGEDADIPLWAWIGAGSGAVAVGAGVAMRMMAVGTHREFDSRMGALTQTEAFELRDRSGTQATGGAILLGVGVAAIAGVAGLVAFDVL